MRNRFYFNVTAFVVTILMIVACATVRPVPVETTTQVQTIIRDSIQIHRDTVVLEVPVETSSAFDVQYSHLETTVALSDARVDSTGLLSHTLVNKPFKVEKEIIYQDHKVVEYRDSIQVKEVPVEVEVIRKVVPKWCWYLLVLNVLALVAIGVRVYLKFKK